MASAEQPCDCADKFPDSAYCAAFQSTLELLGRRWTAAIMRALFVGPLRFNEAGRLIPGISHRLLTERLGELQEGGLVERRDDGTTSVYLLTEQGRDLRRIFEAVEAWNRRWLTDPDAVGSGT
ncbi:MAG: helix-turn-helix transcriptional regulator [Dehalococcoidia bacterium]|nr:helix-turn-helix transcriptional regulator [Dehalococcoidia bacterium]MCA9849754.1 helix-turn-helix transcriptional regulator [Dehalococcoidia bacterium]MCA9855678.1 helix-turn-helix transcriptional regulator [Dehalococcoidia bacterium]